MYGPTETTIWSTTTTVTPGTRVTIGRPIANTTISFVDQAGRPVPLGVPGELLIGGAGVARGYLDRPELTAERFTDLARGERMYRTGDLARWLPSGEIEFLGRLDSQVKIRGYRIELGEIEAVIAMHPRVRECVVVARAVGADAKLIGYVVPRGERLAPEAHDTTTEAWVDIWDLAYRDAASAPADLDIAGWKSSFTGELIGEVDMREWAEQTVARMRAAVCDLPHPPRVLEIGCGTGMLLARFAPGCAQYVAIDPSEAALDRVRLRVEKDAIVNTLLQRLAAHELDQLSADGPFDLIVLNSVIQYFPSPEYLAQVLSAAYARLAPGGALFVGDVRGREQAAAFYAAVEFERSPAGSSAADFAARVRRRAAEEQELLVAPSFFAQLATSLHGAVLIGAEVKAGRGTNEMINYRYDVTLRRSAAETLIDAPSPVQAPSPCTLDTLRAMLSGQSGVRVVHVVNARTVREEWLSRRLSEEVPSGSLAELAARVPATDAMHPDDLRSLHPDYVARVEFSPDRADTLDVTFVRRAGTTIPLVRRPADASVPLTTWTNRPARRTTRGTLALELRDLCRSKLPDFMVPSAFVELEALPLTPNGKIDRKQLPALEPLQVAATRTPPATDLERTVVRVLEELVAGSVGMDDNFFDAGINSLLMVQGSIRLGQMLGRSVPLVQMFQYPTARSLAAAIGGI